MHIALAFETLQRDPDCNWFALLAKKAEDPGKSPDTSESATAAPVDLQQYVRKIMISMVLGTDMAKHAEHVERLQALAQELAHERTVDEQTGNTSPSQVSPSDTDARGKQRALSQKLFILQVVVHAADIHGPFHPRKNMLEWTRRVLSEFW